MAYGGLPLLPDEGHTGRGALLALFGALDPRADAAAGHVRQLVARGVSARLIVYPDAGRDFFDEARPRTGRGGFAPAAAAAAWRDTLQWLAFFLGAPNQRSSLPPAGAPHRRGRTGGSRLN